MKNRPDWRPTEVLANRAFSGSNKPRFVEQQKHLYNARFGKVKWFIERFGARELIMKPFRTVFSPLIIPALPRKTFQFRGRELPYLYHRYNMTWASERCVEVPIARMFLEALKPETTLEIGNVLSHYAPVEHDILDKFERGQGVINEDIVDFKPSKRYDMVLSISTFEHIGFDDEARGSSAEKIVQAVRASKSLLSGAGRLLVTTPVGYNPELDRLLREDTLCPVEETYLKKFGHLDWRECSKEEALKCRYKEPFPYANAIVVAQFGND